GELPFGDDQTLYVRVTARASIFINFEYRIYVSTVEFITTADDTPALQPYSETLIEPLDFTWSMSNDQSGLFGGFITGRGTTIIDNMDTRYDDLTQFYTTDGRPVEVRLGLIGTLQTTWPVVFKGLSSGEFIDDKTFEITDEDLAYKLDVPAQARTYGGTGGLDGTADIAGKPMPLCFGWCRFIQGALVIPNELLYQVHDRRIQAISAAYDQGVALTFHQDYATVEALRLASIPSGRFGTCLAYGFARLNQDVTPDGAVTFDVQGDATDGFAETTAAIVRALIKRSTKLSVPGDLFLPSFTALEKLQPAPVGIYLSTEETSTVADVIGQLMLGIGGYAGFRREGKLYVGRIDTPLGPPVKRFTDLDIDPNPAKQ
ncbi:MAG: hypothetical protein MK097_03855, partial [Dechloromonas sp.]|nr:hypothetical protein [Dechloromonas sp.]